MADYDNTNTGVLFKNNQEGNPSRPWYKGKINIEGQEYELAAWVRESKKDGSKFLSLKASPAKEKGEARDREQPPFEEEAPY